MGPTNFACSKVSISLATLYFYLFLCLIFLISPFSPSCTQTLTFTFFLYRILPPSSTPSSDAILTLIISFSHALPLCYPHHLSQHLPPPYGDATLTIPWSLPPIPLPHSPLASSSYGRRRLKIHLPPPYDPLSCCSPLSTVDLAHVASMLYMLFWFMTCILNTDLYEFYFTRLWVSTKKNWNNKDMINVYSWLNLYLYMW